MASLVQTPASVLKSSTAQVQTGTAGATIVAGNVLYIDTADSNKLKLADCDAASPANVVAGIALNGASAGQPVAYTAEDTGLTPGCTMTVGAPIYLSPTAGELTETYADLLEGDTVIVLGVALTATTMNFNPITGGTVPAP